MALSGKHIVLDIGQVECKIVEVSISGAVVSILNTVEMRDMSPFITPLGTLMNFSGFIESLEDTLKQAGITTKSVIITSSVLDIKSKLESQSTKSFKDTKELYKHYQDTCGRQASNVSISDYQLYGTIPSEDEITYRVVLATCTQLFMLKDLIAAFREHKFQIVSIQPTYTALCNLNKFYKPTYDQPGLFIFDFGHIRSTYVFNTGTLRFDAFSPDPLCDIQGQVASKFNIPPIVAKKILYTIGIERTEPNRTELFSQGIDGNEYFRLVNEIANEALESCQKYVATILKEKKCGNSQILLTGGIMDIPGMADLFEDTWKDRPVTTWHVTQSIMSKSVQVVNKQQVELSAKYAACIGAAIVNSVDKSTNLVPKETNKIDLNNISIQAARWTRFGAIALTTVLALQCLISLAQMFVYRNVPQYLEQTNTAVASAKAMDAKYKDYLAAIQDIDDVVNPLLEFIASYPTESICIASFDTPDMLIPVELDENGKPVDKKPKYTFNADGIAVDTDGNPVLDVNGNQITQEVVEQEASSSEPTRDTKQDIIIRGYATSSVEVTNFYTKLGAQHFVPQLAMVGVKEITLQTEEQLYIFEMRIVRGVS